jgi:tetratricopeptide (TPR) repeat protein
MARIRGTSVRFLAVFVGLCLSSISVFPSTPASAFAPAAEPSSWLEVHSTHFTVITDAGEKKGREVALRFEQMRAVFGMLLGKERLVQPVPLTILAFRNDKPYYQLAPLIHVPATGAPATNAPPSNAPPSNSQASDVQGNVRPIDVPGFFLHGDDQDFIVLNLSEEESWRAVAHDFAAMLLSYNYPPAQGWFDDGLAEYFSTIRVDNKRVEMGSDPAPVRTAAKDPAGNQQQTPPEKSLTELLNEEAWLPLPVLFAMKHDSSTRNQGTRRTLYYAESWMIMHYLLNEKKLPETGAYFGLVLNQHVPVEEAIQKAYGMSSAELEKAVQDYFHARTGLFLASDAARTTNSGATHAAGANALGPGTGIPGAGILMSFPAPVGPDDSVITSKPFLEDDERALYAEIEARIPDRRDAGLQELHLLASTPNLADKKFESKNQGENKEAKRPGEDPNLLPSNAVGSALAHRILAWDHIEHGEFDEATTEIADAVALNPSDMWLRYYLSVFKYRVAQAKHAEMQGLPNMMLDLRAVLEWYPEFADAYDLLALARNAGGGPAAAMQAERAAITLSPRDEFYTYHLAQIYVASKKWEAADILFDRLKASNNREIVALAKELMERAANERKYGIPLSAGTMPQAKLSPQKSPFDVLEEDAAKRAAAEKAEQSGGPADMRPTKFVKGRLIDVDCSQAPAAMLTVNVDGLELKLRAADYKSLLLIGADEFSCAWSDRQVTVNYKPGGHIEGQANGDVVSLEVR